MDIQAAYSKPERHYHNLWHIAHMTRIAKALILAEGVSLSQTEKKSLMTAIDYHDVYIGPNHEIASALACYHDTQDALACYLIVTGTTHFGSPYDNNKYLAFLLDIPSVECDTFVLKALRDIIHDADLWALSCDAAEYDKYQRAVIAENLALQNSVTDVYNGRLKFLDWVIARAEGNTLFYTNEGKRLHFKVHANATREKTRLLKLLENAPTMGS